MCSIIVYIILHIYTIAIYSSRSNSTNNNDKFNSFDFNTKTRIPVFGGGTSGIGKLLSPTGGFYFGFLFAALIISLLKGRNNDIKRYILITIFVGMPIIYFMGTVFMCYFNQMTVEAALFAAVVPFLIGDTIKSVIASFLGTKLNNVLRRNL